MIEIDALSKRYGSTTVVDQLSFSCQPGEVLGFLGPNGAGKSTTMKMITGFVTPDGGSARVCGHDIQTDGLKARQKLGYLPEGAPAYAEMTPESFLNFVADIRGLEGKLRQQRLEEVIERLNLRSVLQQSIDTLSKGFKRRVGLAQAILHDPEVLILDEPTDGLDPNQKHEVRELIKSMSKDKLIVISTHILEEVEALCNRAMIIAKGKILADDTPATLAAQSSYCDAVTITTNTSEALADIEAAISPLTEAASVETDPNLFALTAFANQGQQDALWHSISEQVKQHDWPVSGLRLESGRLDDVFRQITRGEQA